MEHDSIVSVPAQTTCFDTNLLELHIRGEDKTVDTYVSFSDMKQDSGWSVSVE